MGFTHTPFDQWDEAEASRLSGGARKAKSILMLLWSAPALLPVNSSHGRSRCVCSDMKNMMRLGSTDIINFRREHRQLVN